MAPKTDKGAKKGGKDIRMFFGGAASSKPSATVWLDLVYFHLAKLTFL
jgi:hypothetical protein